jgi:uncharacterized metal-binding protein
MNEEWVEWQFLWNTFGRLLAERGSLNKWPLSGEDLTLCSIVRKWKLFFVLLK